MTESVETLSATYSLLDVVKSSGVTLTREGNIWSGDCPFHADQNSALLVDPSTQHWQCDGSCQTGGSVVEWLMKTQDVSHAHATEMIRSGLDLDGKAIRALNKTTVNKLDPPFASDDDDQQIVNYVIGYYHQTLKQSPEALTYLQKRKIDNSDAIEHFKLGFCNRTLGYRLPLKNRKEGAALRGRLQRLGLLKSSGHELFRGSIIVPIINNGQIMQVYGRKVTAKLRTGTPQHIYLNQAGQGVFNLEAVQVSDEWILCQSPIDALTFWCAGYRNVTCTYGLETPHHDLLVAIQTYLPKRLLIAYEATPKGENAAQLLHQQLTSLAMETYRIEFPKGLDANEYAVKSNNTHKVLGDGIRQAVWMDSDKANQNSSNDENLVPSVSEENSVTGEPAQKESNENTVIEEDIKPVAVDMQSDISAEIITPIVKPIAASVIAEPATAIELEVKESELIIQFDSRRYRIRGLEKNSSYEQLKINLLISKGDRLHVDSFDLYATRPRHAFVQQAAVELAVKEDVIKKDLAQLLLQLEIYQEKNISKANTAKSNQKELTKKERDEAMVLLQSPNLIDWILEDYKQCGLVGEDTNKLLAYLVALSRKLDNPLAIMIQSTSAAGKTALMDCVLSFVPEEDRVQYSALTGQSLFYMGDMDLKHKILAISEEEGVSQAAYALRLLQSEGGLSIASTGKDPFTGKHTTHEYQVEGPVTIFSTTTAIDIDEELLNRCLVLQINEDRKQTQAIHDWQRYQETLDGMLAMQQQQAICNVHQNAQHLIKPLKVVNPYAQHLTFLDDKTRTRRDNPKYLTLIRTIALLHQHQREIKTTFIKEKKIAYIEVTLDDIQIANQIVHEVLGHSLNDVPLQTQTLLQLIDEMVSNQSEEQRIKRSDVHFTRRDVQHYTGWGMTQISVHLRRLESLEYLLRHRGKKGQLMVYELLYHDQGQDGLPFMAGLIDVAVLEQSLANEQDKHHNHREVERSGIENVALAASYRGGNNASMAEKQSANSKANGLSTLDEPDSLMIAEHHNRNHSVINSVRGDIR